MRTKEPDKDDERVDAESYSYSGWIVGWTMWHVSQSHVGSRLDANELTVNLCRYNSPHSSACFEVKAGPDALGNPRKLQKNNSQK